MPSAAEPMRYDPADRILSLSFAREPQEHADVMLEAWRRMLAGPGSGSPWRSFFMAVGFGVVVGIAMEIHRRLVLPALLGTSDIAPLSVIVVQLLPVVTLVLALYALLRVRTLRRRHSALVARLAPALYIDVDIFPKGISASSGQVAVDVDWPAVRNVFTDAGRIELECESFSLYIPMRAFADPNAFSEAAKEIRKLWREAVKHDRDSRMLAAGLE